MRIIFNKVLHGINLPVRQTGPVENVKSKISSNRFNAGLPANAGFIDKVNKIK
jgi:hypothetical protein